MKSEAAEKFRELLEIMDRLRGPGGCDWDKRQTPRSLVPYLVEETYEVIESIEKEAWSALKEELGDLLLHIVFQAKIGEENKRFEMADVIQTINEKMIRRHPHVFGNVRFKDEEELLKHWENSKLEEGRESLMDGIPEKLPALLRAFRVQTRAAEAGFDWESPEPVWEKIHEEIEELKQAVKQENHERIFEELGDLFFSLVNLARWLNIDPEASLRSSVSKFMRRFRYIEEKLAEKGKTVNDSDLDEMDKLWELAKP